MKGVGSNGSFKIGDGLKNQTKPKSTIEKKSVTKATGEEKPKKNIKKIVKPKIPKMVEAKPAALKKTKIEEPIKEVKKTATKPKVDEAEKRVQRSTKNSKTVEPEPKKEAIKKRTTSRKL